MESQKRPFHWTLYISCHRQQKFLANCEASQFKVKPHRILNLVEKENLIDDEKKTAKISDKYFLKIVQK